MCPPGGQPRFLEYAARIEYGFSGPICPPGGQRARPGQAASPGDGATGLPRFRDRPCQRINAG